jgi:hypothetical protein
MVFNATFNNISIIYIHFFCIYILYFYFLWKYMYLFSFNTDGKQFHQFQQNKQLGWFRFMVFHATFNNISVISWRSVLLVEETRVPEEILRPVASHEWDSNSQLDKQLSLISNHWTQIKDHDISQWKSMHAPGPGLGQAQKYGRVKSVNGIRPLTKHYNCCYFYFHILS